MSTASSSYLQRREALDKAMDISRMVSQVSVEAILADADKILAWMTKEEAKS